MKGIYNYTPAINHVSRVYSVAAVLYLQLVLHVMLIRSWNMLCTFTLTLFRSMCAVHNMALFCIFSISCYPVMFLRYSLSDFEIVPVAPIITGIIFTSTFHMRWIPLMRFYILKASQLLSWSHFCLQELQHLLTHSLPAI